ncbi:MAG: very short patch repair endonuclease [Bacteroidales bacterium]|jgi:DNA mismatch endonuclease (patch repair protein)|nr:very short patch repair endonuclease [Bacteroidales bacterium]MCI2121248.1 very short patch repair endonuclease [Bacteroidales bacterium]MCI2146156.1 very short patch repair endonuclease [Bacteroidales bacterium]
MSDIFSKAKRSDVMSKVHGKDTKPEMIVRKYLFSKGFRYRKNVKKLPGTPDIVLPKYHTVIFVHGCFWHGHEGCRYAYVPKSNVEFWKNKIEGNRNRDLEVREELKQLGWNTIIVWECQLKPKVREKSLEEIVYFLRMVGDAQNQGVQSYFVG